MSNEDLIHSKQFNIWATEQYRVIHLLLTVPPPSPHHISVCLHHLKSRQRYTGVGNMCSCSHVSLKHIRLHCRKFRFVLISALSLSILLVRDLTFPIMKEGRAGLNPLSFSPLCSWSASATSPLQLIWDLRSQSGYYLAPWYLDQLLSMQNTSLFAMVIHHNRW